MVTHPFLLAMQPVADALDAVIVEPEHMDGSDIALKWGPELLGGLRMPTLHASLDRMIDQVERDLGGALTDLSREDKQRALKLLDDRGAFEFRRAVEDVADAFGVSRITIYNYLTAIRGD